MTDEKQLLEIARKAILGSLKQDKIDEESAPTKKLGRPGGAFVSLHKLGQLRGCIGTFTSPRPLVNTVQEMALSSSQRDPRFPPVQEQEMQDIDIEDVNEIEVGRHGIYITKGFYSGVLLPQVATEYGWDRETFLDHTCMKAGLPPDTWKEAGVKIEIFDAQVFGEKSKE